MSKISQQADALRKTADTAANLDDFEHVSVPWMRNKLAPMLREAADTIESLRDRLQGDGGMVHGGTRWYKLFGTPERAARTLASLDEMSCKYCLLRDHCGDSCLLYRRDDALLEWLIRSDA